MPNIAPDRPIEKVLQNLEGLKEKARPNAEKERIKYLEQARKEIINEIGQTENAGVVPIGPPAGVLAPQSAGWRRQKQIETILADGLKDIYLSLTPEKQKQFKKTGEETAAKINRLLAKAKININAIIKLIRKWLELIPGVNRYFLEQEAKIKAEEIVKIKSENK